MFSLAEICDWNVDFLYHFSNVLTQHYIQSELKLNSFAVCPSLQFC